MKKTHGHTGAPVAVGPYTVFAAGEQDLRTSDFDDMDVLIALTRHIPPLRFGKTYQILAAPLADYGGVPLRWKDFLQERVVPLLEQQKRVMAFCVASHGRTGTFLASLISLLETKKETPDPIRAVRERHCLDAVETREQAEAVFAIRGEQLPRKYELEFGREIKKEIAPSKEGKIWEDYRGKLK